VIVSVCVRARTVPPPAEAIVYAPCAIVAVPETVAETVPETVPETPRE